MFFINLEELKEVLHDVLEKTEEARADAEYGDAQRLADEVKKLKKDIAELEFKKSLEEKELKHLVKMKEEKQLIEAQKRELELAQKFQEKEMTLQKEYHNKVMAAVKDGQKRMEEIYGKIVERLPNVNLEISKSR